MSLGKHLPFQYDLSAKYLSFFPFSFGMTMLETAANIEVPTEFVSFSLNHLFKANAFSVVVLPGTDSERRILGRLNLNLRLAQNCIRFFGQ